MPTSALQDDMVNYHHTTEHIGPFHVEYEEQTVLVRCKQPFQWRITWPSGMQTKPSQAARFMGMYMSMSIVLSVGMEMVLSTVGHDDVVIEGR